VQEHAGARRLGFEQRICGDQRTGAVLASLPRLDPEWVVLVWNGVEEPVRRHPPGALRHGTRTLGIAERVVFLGHRESVGDVLDALDAFTVTSRTEGMSNAMLEALAAGVPVVSTPVSSVADALEPLGDGRRPGLIVEPAAETLAEVLVRLLADRDAHGWMAEAARARACDRFAWEDKIDRWEALLLGR